MYTIKFTGEFKRQMKMCERRGYDMELLRDAIRTDRRANHERFLNEFPFARSEYKHLKCDFTN